MAKQDGAHLYNDPITDLRYATYSPDSFRRMREEYAGIEQRARELVRLGRERHYDPVLRDHGPFVPSFFPASPKGKGYTPEFRRWWGFRRRLDVVRRNPWIVVQRMWEQSKIKSSRRTPKLRKEGGFQLHRPGITPTTPFKPPRRQLATRKLDFSNAWKQYYKRVGDTERAKYSWKRKV